MLQINIKHVYYLFEWYVDMSNICLLKIDGIFGPPLQLPRLYSISVFRVDSFTDENEEKSKT